MAVLFLWELGLTLFTIYIITLIIGSILLFNRALKNTKTLGKFDTYGFCISFFFIIIIIGFFLRVYFMFFLAHTEEEFLMQITATHRSAEAIPAYAYDGRLEVLHFFWHLHMIFVFSGIGFLMYGTEKKIYRKTRYFFTIFIIITIVLTSIFPYEIAQSLFYIAYISPIGWLLIYMRVIKKSSGAVRKNALMLVIGFLIYVLGIMANSGTVRRILFGGASLHVSEFGAIFAAWISPIVLTVGFIIMILAFLSKFSSAEEIQLDESTKILIEKLGLDFTKPEDLTDEDVAFYREQIICLVCKTNIMRFYTVFVCPECKALYCENCARALSKLENACWSCDTPIDETKPVKFPKTGKEEVEIEEEIHKEKKN